MVVIQQGFIEQEGISVFHIRSLYEAVAEVYLSIQVTRKAIRNIVSPGVDDIIAN